MSDAARPLTYTGPAVGDTVNGRIITATRGTVDGGNFVSFDGGANYIAVADLGLPDAPVETAEETLPQEAEPSLAAEPGQ